MTDPAEAEFNANTSRLLRREALRRAAQELNTASAPGLEQALASISREVTEEAARRQGASDPASQAGSGRSPGQTGSH